MPLMTRKKVLAAKIETTIGTAETLSAADAAFNIFDPVYKANVTMTDQESQGGFGYAHSVAGARSATITFRTYLEWDGTATEPLWADTFFPACGYVKTGQVYTPRSESLGSNVKTLTIGFYHDGKLMIAVGCAGKFKVTLPSGNPGYIDWEFMGVHVAETTAAMLEPNYPNTTKCKFSAGVAQWNNVDLILPEAVIDSGNELFIREQPVTSGYLSAIVTTRRPKITAAPEAVPLATQDRWGDWLLNSEYAIELYCAGPTTALLKFDAPKCQILNNSIGDRSGLVTDEAEWGCNKNGATHDQELSITFTAAV